MKTNTMMRVASVLLVAVLLSTCAIAGTYAKYVSSSTGTDSARVAKWDFTIDGTDITLSDSFTFDLFTTAYDENAVDKDGNGSEVVIAPGTQGNATVTLTNNSEVAATYAVDFTANENGVPLQWSVDGQTWHNDISDLDVSATAIAMNGGTVDITIYWKWAFVSDNVVGNDQSDSIDTNLGTAETLATVTFTADVTVTQVDRLN